MEFRYRLLGYSYKYYTQGDAEWVNTFALIYAPKDASFANVRSTLIKAKHVENQHEIDIDSVEDLTIKW